PHRSRRSTDTGLPALLRVAWLAQTDPRARRPESRPGPGTTSSGRRPAASDARRRHPARESLRPAGRRLWDRTSSSISLSQMTRTALVLSGGGMFGAYQAGAWKALSRWLTPDVVVGASVGALNGWLIAAGAPAPELERLWLEPSSGEIME